jgi:hypothetical protein
MDTAITKEELLEKAKQLAMPINFEALIEDGVLERKGGWYKILDITRLPEYAKAQIVVFCTDGKVKFSKSTKAAQKLIEQLSK